MYKALSPSAVGIKTGSLVESVDLAKKAGFQGL